MILAIDPGPERSAYVLLDKELKPIRYGIVENEKMLGLINDLSLPAQHFVFEMVASYGMPVGKEVFETVEWAGRFLQKATECNFDTFTKVYRKEVTLNLCQSHRAKDSNVTRALIDRFAQHNFKTGKGTKEKPDWFYGFHDDIWSAYAVGITYADNEKVLAKMAGSVGK